MTKMIGLQGKSIRNKNIDSFTHVATTEQEAYEITASLLEFGGWDYVDEYPFSKASADNFVKIHKTFNL